MVLLKRLADALRDGDRILAVVRGTAANQDGRTANLADTVGDRADGGVSGGVDCARACTRAPSAWWRRTARHPGRRSHRIRQPGDVYGIGARAHSGR